MKKITLFIIFFISIVIFAYAQPELKKQIAFKETKAQAGKNGGKATSKGTDKFMKRSFEIGLANLSLGHR